MSALGVALVAVAAFSIGYLVSPTKVQNRIYRQKGIDDVGGDSWSIYIDSTDDPDVYVGIYEQHGTVKYKVKGRGTSDTLEKLSDEIKL